MAASPAVADTIPVFAEPGRKWVFVSALDWPGWARRGKSAELALATLESYLPRYAPIVASAGLAPVTGTLTITERHPEPAVNADFGSLHEVAPSEHQPLTAAAGARFAALLEAEWAAFDEAAGTAPAQLRKGPRGGGRDTSQILAHVREAEVMYVRKMGLPRDATGQTDADAAGALRTRVVAALRDPASVVTPPKGWSLRYAARRIGWHVLDHLWEIEDKS